MKTITLITALSSFSFFSTTGALSATENASFHPEKPNPAFLSSIQIAENYSGGYAFKAECEDHYGTQYYSVEISNQNGEPSTLWIDMNQSKVLDVRPNFSSPEMADKNSYWFVSLKNGWNITLATAIERAERQTNASALRADYDGNSQYEVDLITDTGLAIEVYVDAEINYDD
jgi:uncharacterized membrane protein YkoI